MKDVRKVLHAYKIYHPDVDGGIPAAIATLSASPSPDFSNSILVARARGFAKTYQSGHVPVEAVPSFGTLFSTPLAPTYPLAFLRRAQASDIVVHHAPFPLTDIVARRLQKRVALIVYWHADIAGFPLLRKVVSSSIRKTLQRADRIIVSDRSIILGSPPLVGFEEKCRIIPYGADLNFWSTSTREDQATADSLRQKYPRMVLAIGRLVTYKGFATLLRALVHVDAQAVIVGEGPLFDDLKRLAWELGVYDRVAFTGRLPAATLKPYLYAAKVFAFPSVTKAEAFGIVQLEAMSAGLPVVNTLLPTAVPEVARHGLEAITVAPGDADAFAKAIQLVLHDQALADRMGHAGKARALFEFSPETYIARVEQVYREALADRSKLAS